ncbi:hypothetical protein MMC19_002554 [Ptychographa xylographoides]|nr:hypothetical protein [Ptychographa xylographoides]
MHPRQNDGGISIRVGNKLYHIEPGILHTFIRNFNHDIDPLDQISLRDLSSISALNLLFTHLSELSRNETSAALLQGLEDSWRRTNSQRKRGMPNGYHGHYNRRRRFRNITAMIFDRLSSILMHFSALPALTIALSIFFARHAEDIFQRSTVDGIIFLRALECVGEPMTQALGLLARNSYLVEQILDKEEYLCEEYETSFLTRESLDELYKLAGKARNRKRLDWIRKGGRGRGQRSGIMGGWSGRMPIRGRRGRTPIYTGNDLDLEYVQEIWYEEPHNLFFVPNGGRGRGRRLGRFDLRRNRRGESFGIDDDYDDDYDDVYDEEDFSSSDYDNDDSWNYDTHRYGQPHWSNHGYGRRPETDFDNTRGYGGTYQRITGRRGQNVLMD